MEQIGVSVGCTVYNHQKYLRKCLDGFVSQKTKFKFEVLVHDDASTDNSAEIIREYAAKYPEIIKPIFQTTNQFSKGISIAKNYILPNIRGKYYAFCEGDDYWCDEYKLQRQFDVMERNPECRLCVHAVRGISEDEEEVLRKFPPFKIEEGIIKQKQFYEMLGRKYPFQTSCYFRRTEDVIEYLNNPPVFRKVAGVGDVPILLYWGTLGKVYYIDSEMSCYRIQSIGSWSSSIQADKSRFMIHQEETLRMYNEFNKFSNMKYKEELAPALRDSYLNLCLLKKDDVECARVLCKKENQDYLKQYGMTCRVMVWLRAYCPWLAKILYKIKGK